MQAHSSSGNAINRFGRGVVVAVVAGAAAWVYSWQTSLHAQAGTIPLVPTAGVTPPLTIVTVNDGPDYQLDPHVSGDLVSYLDGIAPPTLRYFRFSNGSDTEIPRGDSNGDLLSDVSGTRISFTRYRPDRTATMLFDTSTLTTTEILPSERSNRLGTAIGGDTVAFVDYGIGSFVGDIVAYDIVSGTSQLLSNSAEHEDYPQVAPDGSAIVWARCVTVDRLCDVLAAFRAQGVASWTTRTVAGVSNFDNHPDTDGTWIVYDADVTGSVTGRDIYLTPLTGGPIRQLALPGAQFVPRIKQGVISFVGADVDGSLNVFVYVITTNTLYRITSTAAVNEDLHDIDILASGEVRLAWVAPDGPGGEPNVYATTVRLPLTTATYQTCLLYDGDLVKKRGSAFPIKLQLCDVNGNNLSSPSIPLHATSVTQVSTNVEGEVDTSGNANPDADFRYDAALAGYILNLSTKSLSTGTYRLNFTAGSDTTAYSAPFAIK